MATTEKTAEKKLKTVPLNWNEVYYTNCLLVSASNVDQELGWTKEEYKKIGVNYLYLRARELVSPLHPQPRQPHPLRRFVPSPSTFTWTSTGPGSWVRRECARADACWWAPGATFEGGRRWSSSNRRLKN